MPTTAAAHRGQVPFALWSNEVSVLLTAAQVAADPLGDADAIAAATATTVAASQHQLSVLYRLDELSPQDVADGSYLAPAWPAITP